MIVFQVAQYAVLIVKYAKDQRYDESGIATHCGQVRFQKIIIFSLTEACNFFCIKSLLKLFWCRCYQLFLPTSSLNCRRWLGEYLAKTNKLYPESMKNIPHKKH